MVLWVIIVIMLSYLERHGEGGLGDVVIVLSDLERHGKGALGDTVIILSDLERHGEVGLSGQQRAWTAEGDSGGLRSD